MTDIIDILVEKQIDYRKSNNPSEILLKCTAGVHEDKNPSLHYNLEKNMFHCWSCGFKGSSTQFLKSIGVVTNIPIESKQEYKILKLRRKLNTFISTNEIILPHDRRIVTTDFKNISLRVLKEFNAFFTESQGLEDYLCIPVYQYNKLKFIEGRYRFKPKEEFSKYLRKPYGADVTNILFPLDKVKNYSNIILVEGIFDLLNLWQHGFDNVLCIFGTNNFDKRKVEILDRVGIISVQICMDGDLPGRTAADRISKLLETSNIKSTICNLPTGKDPGDLTAEEAKFYLSQTTN